MDLIGHTTHKNCASWYGASIAGQRGMRHWVAFSKKKKRNPSPRPRSCFCSFVSQEDTMRMPLTLPRREQRQKSQTGRSGCAGPLPLFRFVRGWYICIFRRDRTLSTPAPRFKPRIHTTRQCESPTNRQGACQTHHGAPTTTTTRINK